MSAPAPAPTPARTAWAPSPITFACECGARVREGEEVFWVMGCPMMTCATCAREVLEMVPEARELKGAPAAGGRP